jgi:DNA-binding beta-propeller fold protein YncE
MKKTILVCILALAANCFVAGAYAADSGYHLLKRIEVGGAGGWDYLTVDSAARRLYLSRSTHVTVVDLDSEKVVGDIPNTPGVHGIALAPELNRGFTSNGKANTATIFDLKTLKVLGEVKTGTNPDCIIYDSASKRVFTFNGRSNDATIFQAATGKLVRTLKLGGKPEFAAADGKGKVYVNIADANKVVEIDSFAPHISRRFTLNSCQAPTGMGLDAEGGRIFSGCRNQIMTVLDVRAGVVASVPIGAKVDANAFDSETGLAFSSNGDGTLTIAHESSPGKFEVVETVATQAGSRTMALDPKTHIIYLPAARFSQPKESALDDSPLRPVMEPGSFEVLVVGK